MNSVLLLLFGLFVCLTAGHGEHRRVLQVFNSARQSVNPPCDYRDRSSPCNGQRRNSLPALRWSSKLQKVSAEQASLCPTSASPLLPATQSQLFGRSRVRGDARSEEQTLIDTVTTWSTLVNPGAYNSATGVAVGPDGRAFKTVINAANREVGCAVNLNCGGTRVIICTFDGAVPAGPAYPILSKDLTVTNQFRDSIVTWVNRARQVAFPRPAAPLQALSWDDSLAASAQSVADRQNSHPAVWDPKLGNVQTVFSLNYIQANPGFAFVAYSFTRGVRYNYRQNACRHGRRCGLYTQLVGKDVSKIGCGLSWKNGATFVVCQFDVSYQNQGVSPVKP